MIFTLARFLSCGIWMFAGLYKLLHFRRTTEDMKSRGIPHPAFALVITLVLELVGSVMLFTNAYVWLVVLFWIGFIILATPFYHGNFVRQKTIFFPEYVQFFKNVSIVGGLLALAALDPALPALLRG